MTPGEGGVECDGEGEGEGDLDGFGELTTRTTASAS